MNSSAKCNLIGEMSFLSRRPRATNVIANEEVTLMVMGKIFFKAIPGDLENKIKNYLIEVLIERLNNMNDSFSKISGYMNGLSYQLEKCGFKKFLGKWCLAFRFSS